MYAPRPAFQDVAVKAYLANPNGPPSSKLFNAAGRGYPDVSALAHKFVREHDFKAKIGANYRYRATRSRGVRYFAVQFCV